MRALLITKEINRFPIVVPNQAEEVAVVVSCTWRVIRPSIDALRTPLTVALRVVDNTRAVAARDNHENGAKHRHIVNKAEKAHGGLRFIGADAQSIAYIGRMGEIDTLHVKKGSVLCNSRLYTFLTRTSGRKSKGDAT